VGWGALFVGEETTELELELEGLGGLAVVLDGRVMSVLGGVFSGMGVPLE